MAKKLPYSFYLTFVLAFILNPIFITNASNNFNFRQISSKEGLSNSAISDILQDKDGMIWMGSVDGMNMFDGITISNFNAVYGNILSGNLIESISESDYGIFWIHTNYGLNRFEKKNNKIKHFPIFKGKILIQISDTNDTYVLSRDLGFYFYDKNLNDFRQINISPVIKAETLNFKVYEGKIYIFTLNGVLKIFKIKNENKLITFEEEKSIELENAIEYCFFDEKTTLIIDKEHNLFEYNLNQKNKTYIYNLSEEIAQRGEVSSIIKKGKDYFIGFKTDGLVLLKYNPLNTDKYNISETGRRVGIFCLRKDKYQDIIWVGTDGQGVYIYSTEEYNIRSVTSNYLYNKAEKPIRALYLDTENSLWIGYKGDGILKIDNYTNQTNILQQNIKHYTPSTEGLESGSVYAFSKSSRNILWIGTEEGLNYYSYKDKKIKKIDVVNENRQSIKFIHSICEISDSILWLSTVGTGIIELQLSGGDDNPVLSKAKTFSINQGEVSSNYFYTIHKSNNNTLWFGNRGYGAFKIMPNKKSLESLTFSNLSDNKTINDVYAIHSDKKGNMWFGTSYGLVKKSPQDQYTLFNEKDGFINNTIHAILEDSRHNLWLSTNQGVIKFDTDKETFQVYNRSHGLDITEFSDGAAFKDEIDGTLYFGGINGFIIINESYNPHQEYMPPIYFNKLTILGKDHNIYNYLHKQDNSETLILNYKQNFFNLSFTAIDYIDGNNYSYYYRMEELHDEWIDNGSLNSISFTNLSPGTYSLKIKYKNRNTGIESNEYEIFLKIKPPWYMTAWAYLLYTLIISGIIVLIVRNIIFRIKERRQRALEILEKKHQQEIYESKLSFFTNIAHEFCTPLTLIYGPCNRILSHKGSDSFVRNYALLIQQNAETLNTLIQELIEFRQIDSGNRKPLIRNLQINILIQPILESFKDIMESKKIDFKYNMQNPLEWNCDKGSLSSIVTNLMSNAIKYTTVEGKIKFEAWSSENELNIIISNTGKGIKEEDMASIFDRYNILDNFENPENENTFSRNGLGLAITSGHIKLLNGSIKVESTPNEWTRFIVRLPYNKETDTTENELNIIDPQVRVTTPREIPKFELNRFDEFKPTILIIDDDLQMLWFICEIFEEDYNVIPLHNINEIDLTLKETLPNIIICDVMMPGVDGITITQNLKANPNTAHIPMILVSAKNQIEEQIAGLAAGAEMYIAKPFNVHYIKTAVNKLITRKEVLKGYFSSPLSAFELNSGKMTHKEHKKFMQDIIDIINKNITNKKLNTQFIASEMNMSVRNLYRKMEGLTDKNPAELIKEGRLYIAKNLLLNTKLTIDEIIYKSGFSNRVTFFKSFTNVFGCTPGEFREKNLDKFKQNINN